jgi:hypothetical protein
VSKEHVTFHYCINDKHCVILSRDFQIVLAILYNKQAKLKGLERRNIKAEIDSFET